MNKIRLEKHEDILIVYFSGEIDSLNVLNYRNVLASEIESHVYKVVLMDFNEVTFMDSSGIGVVIGRLKKIQNRDGKVCITNVNKRVDKVFTLSGLYKIITVYRDINEAVESI